MHLVAAASETLPAAHPVQAAEPEPVVKVPGLQAMQSWYVPEKPGLHAHSEISVLPDAGVEELRGHCLQRVDLFVAYEPASHVHENTFTLISCTFMLPPWFHVGLWWSILRMQK